MKQYTFLTESKEDIVIKFYKSTSDLTTNQQNRIVELWKELDKVDGEYMDKILPPSCSDSDFFDPPRDILDDMKKMPLQYVTAELNNEIIGYCGILPKSSKSVNRYAIRCVCVDPKYRGQGIGNRLMEYVKKKFKGNLFIKVVANNNPAYNLYKKIGFKPWLINMVM